jgi:hypothetical protein
MTPTRIREALQAKTFHPFTIKTTGGRKFSIKRPKMAWLHPGGRTMFVASSPEAAAIVDMLMIEPINVLSNGHRGGDANRRNRKRK